MIGSLRRSLPCAHSMSRIVRMFSAHYASPAQDLKFRLAALAADKGSLQSTISQGFSTELELFSKFASRRGEKDTGIEIAELEKFYNALLDKEVMANPKSQLGVLIALNVLNEINPASADQESLAENFLAPLSEDEWDFESLSQRIEVLQHLINYFEQVPQGIFHFLDKQIKTHLYNPRLRSDPHLVLRYLGRISSIQEALVKKGKQGLPASVSVLKELIDGFVKQPVTPKDWDLKTNIAMLELSLRDERFAANTLVILGEIEHRLSGADALEETDTLSSSDLVTLLTCAGRTMSKRLKFLSNIESVVLEHLPALEQQDVALVTHVYALYGQASTLFYLELERFLGTHVQSFSSETVADLLNSILLVHQKMRSKILDAFESVIPSLEFTSSQAIKILRAYEFMGRERFEGKDALLSCLLVADPKDLSIVELFEALEIIQANYYLNRLQESFAKTLNESIAKANWNLSAGKTISMDEPANILACLGDKDILNLISQENYPILNNFIRLSISRGRGSDISLVVSALHRFDQAWDNGLWERKQYISTLEPIVQSLGEVSGNSKAHLTAEERLFLSNMLAKVCHPPWNNLAASLLLD